MKASSKNWWNKFSLIIFPLLVLLILTLLVSDNRQIFANKEAVMYAYLDSVSQGKYGYGINVKYYNDISLAGLEVGDIILGGYPDCAYGRFSHVGIYNGNGQVLEAFVDYGVHTRSIDHFRDYTEVCLLRVEADPEVKKRAVEYASEYQGNMFYALAFKPGDRIWNCSKIIWKAYKEQGIELDESGDLWITPDAFYYSPHVSIIREKGN